MRCPTCEKLGADLAVANGVYHRLLKRDPDKKKGATRMNNARVRDLLVKQDKHLARCKARSTCTGTG